MTETGALQIVQDMLITLERHWNPKNGSFKLEFYSDGSFGVGYHELDPKNPDPEKRVINHTFYSAKGIGELLAYCNNARESPAEAYVDR